MSEFAWYIGAAAVRRYLDVTGETLSFEAAAEKLSKMAHTMRSAFRAAVKPRSRIFIITQYKDFDNKTPRCVFHFLVQGSPINCLPKGKLALLSFNLF